MSSVRSIVTRSSYNVPLEVPTDGSSEFLSPSEHPLRSEYEPAFKPIVLSGLAAIQWAGQQNSDLLTVPPLNDLSYPPIHPDFARQAARLNNEEALAAQAGAAVLAIASAYQTWMHVTNTEARTVSDTYRQYETNINHEIDATEAQRTAGDILYSPGFRWDVTDLSVEHAVNSGSTGVIRLSAAISKTPEDTQESDSPETMTERYYFLNLSTSFNHSISGSPGWATGKVEAGIIDHGRFATIDDGVSFDRLVKFAQVLNSLAIGEARLADTPTHGYTFTLGRTSI